MSKKRLGFFFCDNTFDSMKLNAHNIFCVDFDRQRCRYENARLVDAAKGPFCAAVPRVRCGRKYVAPV